MTIRRGHRNAGARVGAVAVVSIGVALLALALGSTAPVGATGTISVDKTAVPYEGDCVPTAMGRLAWTYDVDSTADHFRLSIHNPSTLCDAVDATAVIYEMPVDGSWPQRLAATEGVTIREASTTVITFTKDCQPAQFDVVTGATPDVIDVSGAHHGPLLFPGALDTSEQHHAPGCTTTTTVSPTSTEAPTSTTAPSSTTTTSSTSSTTSTSIASVAGATTSSTMPAVAGASVEQGATSNGSPEVLGATATRSSGSALALTGSDAAAIGGAGLLLLAVGVAAVALARRRREGLA
ncbi:hypothetical protein [Dermatobacter hominis]|uniref:hypothetical protein n=1 Tax=Dermatobacter hominis TaxID=2884263 RepID=UPI001D114760|nr:hypothetical protein [Dermatobacter hominis]UDY37571.1 hypothetical protein LH044_08520 [Dermatobacter hominis]